MYLSWLVFVRKCLTSQLALGFFLVDCNLQCKYEISDGLCFTTNNLKDILVASDEFGFWRGSDLAVYDCLRRNFCGTSFKWCLSLFLLDHTKFKPIFSSSFVILGILLSYCSSSVHFEYYLSRDCLELFRMPHLVIFWLQSMMPILNY